MVDQMLANKDVNIKWLPDDVERILYVNVITLMLQVLDEVVTVSRATALRLSIPYTERRQHRGSSDKRRYI